MATELARIINSQGLAISIQGKYYVKVEGWTTLGIMLGCTAREVSTTADANGIYTAVVELVRIADGACVSRASAECGSDDEKDRYGRPLWTSQPRYARRSMAQTRATAKACRLAFSWVITLAGYEPTPAEEMPLDSEVIREQKVTQKEPEPQDIAPAKISASQLDVLTKQIEEAGLEGDRVASWVKRKWNTDDFADLTHEQWRILTSRLKTFSAQVMAEREDCPT
jgi:hypothetical protein